jgi:hypothetical protein
MARAARVRGELGEGEGVGCAEFVLPLGAAEDAPSLGGDPVDAGHVGGGEDAFGFEELGVALGAGGVGDDGADLVALGGGGGVAV